MKIKLQSDASFDPTFLSVMDTVFMLFYAVGSFFSGLIGDWISGPLIVAIGLIGSSLCMLSFAFLVSVDIEKSENEIFRTFTPLFLWLLHGLLQSTGGPANTSIMSHWFGYKHRGYVFGTWTCHQYVGNIFSALLASVVLASPFPWTFVFYIPAILAMSWGFLSYRFIPERPEDVEGLDVVLKSDSGRKADSSGWPVVIPSITVFEAVRIPNVLIYSLSFGFFKFVNYSMFFWLPFYLSQHFDSSRANLISVLYDFGMIPGGILVGYFSDFYGGRRACVIATFTCALIPFLGIFAHLDTMSSVSTSALLCALGIMGCLIGGPINIITSAVAIDLAEHSAIGGRSDLMTVTGIINGFGSVFAAFGLLIIGPVSSVFGWQYVWYILICSTLIGTLLLSPAILKELNRAPLEAHQEKTLRLNGNQNSQLINYQSIPLNEEAENKL